MDIYLIMLLRKCISLYWDHQKKESANLYQLMEERIENRMGKAAIQSWLTKTDKMNPKPRVLNILCELLPEDHFYYGDWERFQKNEEQHDLAELLYGKQYGQLSPELLGRLKKDVNKRAADIFAGKVRIRESRVDPTNIPELPEDFTYRGQLMKASDEDLEGIYSLALKDNAYGDSELNPPHIKMRWKKVNDNVFYVVKDAKGSVVGNLNILPLTKDCYFRIRDGEIEEKEIMGKDIVPDIDRDQIRYIYVEGFRCLNQFIMIPFLYNTRRIIQSIANPKNEIIIGAYAGTSAGEFFLLDTGFKKVSKYKNAGQNFYESTFGKVYSKIANRYGECFL